MAAPFARVISSTSAFPSARSMSATTTLAPSPAKIRAMLAPMPEAAPVISATLLSSLIPCPPLFAAAFRSHHRDLAPQIAGEQAFRNDGRDAAHAADRLRHPEADPPAA